MTDWLDLTRRAALASHRLIGWIYWDPVAMANYTALGGPEDGLGYYVATRGASLGDAGILDGAWRSYADDWLPRSRGADDDALSLAFAELEGRGLAEEGAVLHAGVEYRQGLEDRLDDLSRPGWERLGEEHCLELLDLVEPVGARLVARIDETAGPNWMPAARDRPIVAIAHEHR